MKAERFCTAENRASRMLAAVSLCAGFFCIWILCANVIVMQECGQWISLAVLAAAAVLTGFSIRFLPKRRTIPAALFAVRFLCAAAVILLIQTPPVQDFNTMYTAAVQLAHGSHEYLNLDTAYFYNWAYQTAFVIYESWIIRLFGEGYLAIQLLNALWMAGTTVLIYAIAGRLFSERAAVAAGVLSVIYPAPLLLASVLTNQHLAAFLIYLGLWVLISGKTDELPSYPRCGIAGMLFALGNAMRPVGIIALLAAVIWLVIRLIGRIGGCGGRLRWMDILKPAKVIAVYFVVGALLSLAVVKSGANPYGLSNHQPMWKFVLGFNEESVGCWNREDYESLYLLQGEAADAAMRDTVKERLSVGPARLLALMNGKTERMWGACESAEWGFAHMDGTRAVLGGLTVNQLLNGLLWADKGVYLLILLLSLGRFGLNLHRRSAESGELCLILLFCGYFAVHLMIEVQVRYRYFVLPALIILAGGTAAELAGRTRRHGRRERV